MQVFAQKKIFFCIKRQKGRFRTPLPVSEIFTWVNLKRHMDKLQITRVSLANFTCVV